MDGKIFAERRRQMTDDIRLSMHALAETHCDEGSGRPLGPAHTYETVSAWPARVL